jgi:hypothetical protein
MRQKKKMTDEVRRALQEAAAVKREKHPPLASVGLDGFMAATDWYSENEDDLRRLRHVSWNAGRVPLADPWALAPKKASASYLFDQRPMFWHTVATEPNAGHVAYPPYKNPRQGIPLDKDEFESWRRGIPEAAYLKYAPKGVSHFLRKHFHHRLAFVPTTRESTVPTYFVRGRVCRVVVCFERFLLTMLIGRLINPADQDKYLASPCFGWPVYDAGGDRWVNYGRPVGDVRPADWRALYALGPLAPGAYVDFDKNVGGFFWVNQDGAEVVAECASHWPHSVG